ncbi:Odorant receptor [Operophtera brumata]|uniref:Odorant receptor n=1 Tax=Operophtera brumata TaxID=104452 RepID=A0A0L7L207_OPEBR|nr:Odorant receptor [Operophtera brumata]
MTTAVAKQSSSRPTASTPCFDKPNEHKSAALGPAVPLVSVSGSSVLVHLRFLRRCGFCRLAPSAAVPHTWRRLHDLYRAAILSITVTYLVQECIYAYQLPSLPCLQERTNMDNLARVLFLLLCHVTSIAKQLVFYRDAARIDSAAHAAGRFARVYSGAAVVTCTLWITFPVLYRLKGQPVDFTLVLLYSYYVTTLVGIANTTMDAFIATILKQCKTQLTILRMNFESLPNRAAALASREPGFTFEAALDSLFRESLAHYNKISEDILLLQDIFGNAILIQFGIGGFILCMAAYKIVSLSILSIEFASMTLFLCCILTELFLYCFYGNEVTVESDRLVQSIYCMEWVRLTPRYRRSLVLVMERAKRPLRPAAGGSFVVIHRLT